MRGDDLQQGAMFSCLSPEQRVPADHPLRPIRQMMDAFLKRLSPRFDAMYAAGGRPSIPPEKLLRALLLQCLYSVRSERLLMEQLDYNLLFRWFVGLNMDDLIWDFAVFSKKRERLLEAEVSRAFFEEVGELAREKGLLSDEHFTVDGTLIEAWAGRKSFKPRAGGDQRTVRHPGYAASQRKRKQAEEISGWFKTVALMCQTRFRGLERAGWIFTWTAAAYNLVRMRNLPGAEG